jgi:hypothetical protein
MSSSTWVFAPTDNDDVCGSATGSIIMDSLFCVI